VKNYYAAKAAVFSNKNYILVVWYFLVVKRKNKTIKKYDCFLTTVSKSVQMVLFNKKTG
jgi:hypothetical protein